MPQKRRVDANQMDMFGKRDCGATPSADEIKVPGIRDCKPAPAQCIVQNDGAAPLETNVTCSVDLKMARPEKSRTAVRRVESTTDIAFKTNEADQRAGRHDANSAAGREANSIQTRLLTMPEVLDRVKISRSLLYELIKDAAAPFPAPVHMGRRSMWIEDEIEAYLYAARTGRNA